jgi:ligand-binding sensor domain-containing protein/signal transduction histidine kinase
MKTARRPGRYAVALGRLLAGILLAWSPSALALDPALDVSQYAHTPWKIRDGFSKGAITSIAQTPDGYLWLGTEFGLLRFDGVKNVPWQPPPDQDLPSSNIRALLAARDGTLWIGTAKGLASWKDGTVTCYSELAGQYIFRLLEDHEGSVWAGGGAIPTGRLCAIRNGSAQCYGEDGNLGPAVLGLYEDSKGNLWAGVKTGLWRWSPGPPRFYPLPGEPDGIQALSEDDDGALLVGWRGAIQRFIDGKTQSYPLSGTVGQFRATGLLRDRDGGLWIATSDRGLVHAHRGRTDVLAQSDSLSGENVHTLFEDREGNIWIGTINGLDRFRDFAVATLTPNQSVSNALVWSVLAATDGSVWLGTLGGLNRWKDGQVTVSGTGSAKADGKLNGLAPNSLLQDHLGRIWVSTQRGLGYLENDRFIPVTSVPGGSTLAIGEDNAGNLWIANEHVGLLHLLRNGEVEQIPWATLGHKDHASVLAPDPIQGGLWLGFFSGGVAYFSEGQVRASYTVGDGLGEGRVNHLRLDKDGTLWVATEGGLSRLTNGRIATLTSKNGLPCDTVHWAMEDDDHSFWLYTACGLVRIVGPQLAAWAAAVDDGKDKDAKWTIQATVFDSSDGVRILASGGHFSPQVSRSADGKFWFLPWDGVSVVDPRHLRFNGLPPPVHIEQITADRKTYDAITDSSGKLRLPSLIRDLHIDYTALSLVAPEKVLFRYRLEGHDQDWQDVGNRRQAFYNDLPPGNYRFRVSACNNSGVWNEAGAFLDFSIAPAYYQTSWFRVSCVAAFLVLLIALYQLRLRQVARQFNMRLEERVKERTRIARELHDTLLQGVQGLVLKFDAVAKQLPREGPARKAMEKALDRADEVLAEGRDRVRDLRDNAISVGDLSAAFQRVAEEIPQGREATFKTVVEGSVRELHPIVIEESYSIGREALINAFTHSEGLHVEVEIIYDPRQFRLRVRDDGRGIDSQIIKEGNRPDHWGLQGMRERAERIGGQLELWSRPATGTEIELIVPAAAAYRTRRGKSKSPWFRRPSGTNGE